MKGPTENSKRLFHDSYDEIKRYKHKEKRARRKVKDRLKEIAKMKIEDLEEDDEYDN